MYTMFLTYDTKDASSCAAVLRSKLYDIKKLVTVVDGDGTEAMEVS